MGNVKHILNPDPERRFRQVDYCMIMDKTLSMAAKGLMLQILAAPPDWTITLDVLQGLSSDGERAIKSALKELEQHGYIKRKKYRLNGREGFGYWWYVVDNPELTAKLIEQRREQDETQE